MSCVIQFTLVAVLRLLGSLCQVLGPTYDRLCIPNFDLRKGNFLLQAHSYSTIFNRAENLIEVVRTLIIIKFKISETMNCRCYHEHQANLILETPSHKPQTFFLAVSRTLCIYFALLEVLILVSLKGLETKLCRHNQKEVILVHYIKVYVKGLLKNDFVYVET